MTSKRDIIIGAVLGAVGGWLGYMVGSGIETSWHGMLLGVFISILTVFVIVTQTPFLAGERIGELVIGCFVGLAAEVFIFRSVFIGLFLGALAGGLWASLTRSHNPYVQDLKFKVVPFIQPLLLLAIIITTLSVLIWAYPRGILKEVLIVWIFIILPILGVLFLRRTKG